MIESLFTTAAEPQVLALATTAHVAILLLRASRNPAASRHVLLLAPSLALSVAPWWFPTPAGLILGLLLHAGWFAACERWIPAAQTATTPPSKRPGPPAPTAAMKPSPKRSTPPSRGFVQVPVIAVFRETDDITTFRMVRPEGFTFAPGQFTSVRINIDGKPVVRCYSISSSPEAVGYFEISVKRQGLMSGTLHASVRPGSMISVMPPAGGFAYPSNDDRPLALLAGGVGITPLMSMLRHAVAADPTRPVTLLYSVNTHRDVAFRDELQWIASRHPQVKIVVTTTRGPHATQHLSGRIDRRMIAEQVDDLSNSIFMICGPGPMIDAMKETLAGLGVPDAQIRSEAFAAAIASTVDRPADQVETDGPRVASFQLRLVESGTTISASDQDTLLDACEAAGIDLPSACRAGVCGTCRARLIDGRVRCDSDFLDEADTADGYILPCVSWPESDCAMEA
jgi:ferredoxin-NADP reductase